MAAQTGRVAEASVLSNLFPAVTVLLAVMLKEPLPGLQRLGLLVTLLAVPLVTWVAG